ncbi:MAG: hypothetical protein E7039_06240 [Lentisphaerae bacterium]|nr:hypothetical protein [Lentisphaerota bacterium]
MGGGCRRMLLAGITLHNAHWVRTSTGCAGFARLYYRYLPLLTVLLCAAHRYSPYDAILYATCPPRRAKVIPY